MPGVTPSTSGCAPATTVSRCSTWPRVEATDANGRRETFVLAGSTAESLRAAYTDDGGHLNATGRAVAAIDFVRALAAAVRIRHAG